MIKLLHEMNEKIFIKYSKLLMSLKIFFNDNLEDYYQFIIYCIILSI